MNQDLKSRIPIAIGYVLLIAACTLLGQISSSLLLMAFMVFCFHEFINALQDHNPNAKNIAIIISVALLAFMILPLHSHGIILIIALISSSIFIFNFGVLLSSQKSLLAICPTQLSSVAYVILPFGLALVINMYISNFPVVLLGIFIILWLNDAGAYFVGRAIGKRKLFPTISPSKTWEGFIGGGVCGLLIVFAIHAVFGYLTLIQWFTLSIIVWLSGVAGDLVESSWKRNLKLKDSGTILKGHGGFLDRLDSFIYSIPFAILYLLFFQIETL